MVFFNKKKAARKKIYNARFSVKGFLILKNTSFADLTASVKPASSKPFRIDRFYFFR